VRTLRPPVILVLLLAAAGCARSPATPRLNTAAAALLDRATTYNSSVTSMRGLGQLDVVQGGKRYQLRVAWIAKPPNQYRVVLLGALGKAVLSVASDGEQVYLDTHDTKGIRAWQAGGVMHNAMTQLVVAPGDLSMLLSGRLPIREFTVAAETDASEDDASALVLSRWGQRVQRIEFRGDGGTPHHMEFYTPEGGLGYWLTFDDSRSVESYQLPGRIEAGRPNGDRLMIQVNRYWPDVTVSADLFVLKPG